MGILWYIFLIVGTCMIVFRGVLQSFLSVGDLVVKPKDSALQPFTCTPWFRFSPHEVQFLVVRPSRHAILRALGFQGFGIQAFGAHWRAGGFTEFRSLSLTGSMI